MPNMPMSLSTGTTTTTQPAPKPECPWQLLGTDYFHFDGSENLVVTGDYSKMPIIRRIPAFVMPPRPSLSWRNSLQNMASQRYSLLTMAPSLPMHSSPSLQQTGSLTITPVYLEIQEAMVNLKQL